MRVTLKVLPSKNYGKSKDVIYQSFDKRDFEFRNKLSHN